MAGLLKDILLGVYSLFKSNQEATELRVALFSSLFISGSCFINTSRGLARLKYKVKKLKYGG